MEEAGVKLIAEGAAAYLGDLRSAENATNSFVDSTEKGSGRINAASEVIIGGLRRVGAFAVEAFGQALQASAAFVGDSIDLAGDFEAGMLSFQAVAGRDVDAQGLEDFRDLFLDIGKRLPVSTSEVQQAATELVKGGIDPATVAAGGLESSIKFAAAAMDGDLAGAAEISAKIVGGWADVTATAAEKAALMASSQDLLTKAANASTVGVQDLSLGLFNVQGNAKLAGISLDETVTALSLIAPNFSNAATAGTSLNAMIARLQPSTAPATAAMQDLGLMTTSTAKVIDFLRSKGIEPLGTDLDTLGNQYTEFATANGMTVEEISKVWGEFAQSKFYDEATGEFIGMAESAQMLQDATAHLTDAQKQQVFQTIFGMDAMGAAAELTRQGADGWNQMAAALETANGVQENAETKQQGFNTALENAKGSVEALQIVIGSALLPVLTELINDVVAPGINLVTDFADAIFGSQDAMDRLSPEMEAAATVVQDLARGIQDLVSWFDQGGAESDALGSAIDDLSGIWEKAGQVVANVLGAYQDIIDSVLPQVQAFIAEHGDEIQAFFDETWNSIIEIVNLALDLYNETVPPILHAIAGFIDDHGSEIQRILGAAWDTISTLISGALDLIKGVITTTLAIVRGDWEGAWTGIEGITQTITDTISGVIEGFLNIIAGFFDTNLDEIARLWENNWNMLVDIATQTDWAQVGRDVVDGIISGLAGAWSSLVGWISDRVSGLVDAALDAIGAGSPAKEWMPVGQFSVQGVMEGFKAWWPSLTKLVDGLGDDLIQQAADLGMAVQNAIGDAFSSTASIDRQIAKNLDSLADDVLPQYQQYTAGALKQAENEARAFLDPTEGAKFFQLRSKQILEYAKLQQDLAEEEDDAARERLKQQMLLINAAQTAELSAFNANLNANQSGTESLMESIQAFLTTQGEEGDPVLPGLLENETIRQITGWMNQLSQMMAMSPYQQAYANPATATYNQRTYNMPVYTNQTPAALQSSMAIMGSMYP